MKKKTGAGAIELIGALLMIGGLVLAVSGWIANIIKLIAIIDGQVTGMMIFRIVGVIAAPLGSILGFV